MSNPVSMEQWLNEQVAVRQRAVDGGGTPGVAAMATGSKSPNATKLFVQYLLSEEGIAPQTIDGKISSNTSIAANPEEASGVGSHIEKLMVYDTATAIEDLDKRQDWQDAWRMALRN